MAENINYRRKLVPQSWTMFVEKASRLIGLEDMGKSQWYIVHVIQTPHFSHLFYDCYNAFPNTVSINWINFRKLSLTGFTWRQRIFTRQLCTQFWKSIRTAANPNPNPNSSTLPVSGHEGGSYHKQMRAKVIIIDQWSIHIISPSTLDLVQAVAVQIAFQNWAHGCCVYSHFLTWHCFKVVIGLEWYNFDVLSPNQL